MEPSPCPPEREIDSGAGLDPGFLPDNSGFFAYLQGGSVCPTSVLTTGAPTLVTFMEPGCAPVAVPSLHTSLAARPGGDYWAAGGPFASDEGGTEPAISFDERWMVGARTGPGRAGTRLRRAQ